MHIIADSALYSRCLKTGLRAHTLFIRQYDYPSGTPAKQYQRRTRKDATVRDNELLLNTHALQVRKNDRRSVESCALRKSRHRSHKAMTMRSKVAAAAVATCAASAAFVITLCSSRFRRARNKPLCSPLSSHNQQTKGSRHHLGEEKGKGFRAPDTKRPSAPQRNPSACESRRAVLFTAPYRSRKPNA